MRTETASIAPSGTFWASTFAWATAVVLGDHISAAGVGVLATIDRMVEDPRVLWMFKSPVAYLINQGRFRDR